MILFSACAVETGVKTCQFTLKKTGNFIHKLKRRVYVGSKKSRVNVCDYKKGFIQLRAVGGSGAQPPPQSGCTGNDVTHSSGPSEPQLHCPPCFSTLMHTKR